MNEILHESPPLASDAEGVEFLLGIVDADLKGRLRYAWLRCATLEYGVKT